MIDIIIEHKTIFVILHAICAAVGLGAVVITDSLFFQYLKDFKISRKEEETMSTISKLVWVVIALLIITGTALFLSAPLDYLAKSKFIVKIIIFSVIVANGLLLNFWITPVLKKIVFGPVEKQPTFNIRFMRRVAFASGVVSMISWFAVFVLGSVRSIPVSIGWGTAIYSGILLLGILGSQFFATWMKYGTLLPNKD